MEIELYRYFVSYAIAGVGFSFVIYLETHEYVTSKLVNFIINFLLISGLISFIIAMYLFCIKI